MAARGELSPAGTRDTCWGPHGEARSRQPQHAGDGQDLITPGA